MKNVVVTVDCDWRITSFNRSAEKITGVTRDEVQDQPCSDVLHSTLGESRCPIRRALAGSPISLLIDGETASGKEVIVLARLQRTIQITSSNYRSH